MLGEYTLNLYVNVRGKNTWHGPGFEYCGGQLLGRTYDWISRPFFPLCALVLLMVQKSGVHQLRLLGYPIIYRFYTAQVVVAGFLLSRVGLWRYTSNLKMSPLLQKPSFWEVSLINERNWSIPYYIFTSPYVLHIWGLALPVLSWGTRISWRKKYSNSHGRPIYSSWIIPRRQAISWGNVALGRLGPLNFQGTFMLDLRFFAVFFMWGVLSKPRQYKKGLIFVGNKRTPFFSNPFIDGVKHQSRKCLYHFLTSG